MLCPYMGINALARELKRGSTELLILALLEERDRHGYELARLIDERSRGEISFHVASLYPTLYRMEEKDLDRGPLGREGGTAAAPLLPVDGGGAARRSPASGASGKPSSTRSTASPAFATRRGAVQAGARRVAPASK